jgi:ankyrin repeat protein
MEQVLIEVKFNSQCSILFVFFSLNSFHFNDMTSADVNIPNLQGETALHLAASNGECDILRFLLKNGASAQQANIDGAIGNFLNV